ncbi:Uncharacterised protein [BD1-7 clade bacterium]|uniref:Mu-like prophage FluMu protein gp27 n=1 Tax=BD1-7 clade bacterium TaxID=2029982 RepID=A0A5S9Q427_9GAMM|nr:Uncharacterised protein [BD1-7 clade bacterium]CAA0111713.1 Uncharacterised protein [BD1-7 clade bacterium]
MAKTKSTPPKRGKASKIDRLPEQVKAFLNTALRNKDLTQEEIRAEVNRQLEALGLTEKKISSAGLSRHATKVEKLVSRMRETSAIADAWVDKLGDKPTGQMGKLLIQMTQTLAFDVAEETLNGEDPASLGLIKDLALTAQRLEKASMDSLKREKEICKAFAEEAASTAEKAAKAAGLTSSAVTTIKKEILGLVG